MVVKMLRGARMRNSARGLGDKKMLCPVREWASDRGPFRAARKWTTDLGKYRDHPRDRKRQRGVRGRRNKKTRVTKEQLRGINYVARMSPMRHLIAQLGLGKHPHIAPLVHLRPLHELRCGRPRLHRGHHAALNAKARRVRLRAFHHAPPRARQHRRLPHAVPHRRRQHFLVLTCGLSAWRS